MTNSSSAASLNISQVLAALHEEFPDLKPSRIRYYDDKGLITPQRSDSGYRKFSEADVGRLRQILRMQRDRYLPLDVIAQRLGDADGAGNGGAGGGSSTGVEISGEPLAQDEDWPSRLTRQELIRATEVQPRFITDLESFGLITPDAVGRFAPVSVPVVKACATLIEYGLEPRHLRPFLTAADREVDLLDQVLAPLRSVRSRRPEEQQEPTVEETEAVMAAAALQLHTSLFRAGLDRTRQG